MLEIAFRWNDKWLLSQITTISQLFFSFFYYFFFFFDIGFHIFCVTAESHLGSKSNHYFQIIRAIFRHRPSRPRPRDSHKRGPPTFLSLGINRKVLVKISIFCPQEIFAGVQISNCVRRWPFVNVVLHKYNKNIFSGLTITPKQPNRAEKKLKMTQKCQKI